MITEESLQKLENVFDNLPELGRKTAADARAMMSAFDDCVERLNKANNIIDTQNVTIQDLRDRNSELATKLAEKDAKIARTEYLLSTIGHAIAHDSSVQEGLSKLAAANGKNVEGERRPLALPEMN